MLGVRIQFVWAKWPENLKAATAGKLQMWALVVGRHRRWRHLPRAGSSKSAGKAKSRASTRRPLKRCTTSKNPPDGPERLAVMLEAKLLVAYAPYKFHASTASGPTWPSPGSRATTAMST